MCQALEEPTLKCETTLLEAFGGSPSVEGPKTVSLAGIEGNTDQQDGPNSDKKRGKQETHLQIRWR